MDELQAELRGTQNPAELQLKLEALLDLFTTGDELSAAIELCKDALRRTHDLCLTSEQALRYASVLLECLQRRGAIAEALDLADDILDRVSSTTIPAEPAAMALCAVISVWNKAGRYDESAALLLRAEVHAAGSANLSCLATYHVTRGHVLARLRRFNEAVACFQTSSSLYRLAGNTAKEAIAAGHAARVTMLAGRFRIAGEAYATAMNREGLTRRAWVPMAGNYAICLLWLGDWEKAFALLEKAEEDALSIGLLADQSKILTVKALIALRRSELDEATQLANRALELARTNALLREEIATLECLGETEYERGNPTEALRFYSECISKGEAVGMTDATTQGKRREAEAWNAQGEYEKARAAAERCIEVAATNEDRIEHAVAHRPLAIAHSLLGDREAAERAFQSGIEEIRTLGERFELAKTLAEFACHLRDSDPTTLALGAAAGYLNEARELFAALGAPKWQERVDRELSETIRLLDGEAETPAVQTAAIARGPRSFGGVLILTRSREMQEILEQLTEVAPSTLPILITGESGTGKELVARAVQELSGRPAERFVAVNCAALPKELHESELFGHEKGSFTGATSEKPGLFEQADGGTIFLDEIGDLDSGAQGKLLRVLEDGELRRVGETKQRRVDVRVVAATNHDLEQSVREGEFRRDLYHRLNGHWVRIPSLRERPEDIEILATHFVDLYQRQYGRRVQLPEDLLAFYKSYSWPGNVRELRQEVHRMVLLTADGRTIRTDQSQVARLAAQEKAGAQAKTTGYASAVSDHERRLIVDALQRSSGNKAKAARILNMSRTTLIGRMKRLGLE